MIADGAVNDVLSVEQVGRSQILLLVVGAAVLFCDGFDAQMASFVAPALSADWGLAKGALAGTFAANLAGLMIGAVAITPLADLFSRRLILMASVFVFGVASMAATMADGVATLSVARFVTGLALGAAMPSMMAAVSDYLPIARRTSLVVILSCAFSLGIAACGVVASYVVGALGWRTMFVIGGLLPIVLLPLIYAFLPEAPAYLLRDGRERACAATLTRMGAKLRRASPVAARTGLSPVTALFRDGWAPITALVWFIYFCSGASLYFLSNWLPLLVSGAGWSPAQAAVSSSLYQVGGLLGGFVIGYIADKIGLRAMSVSIFAAAAITACSGFAEQSLLLLDLCAVAIGLLVLGTQNSLNAFVGGRLYPSEFRATGLGWALGSVRLGGVLAGSLGAGFIVGLGLPLERTFMIIAAPELLAGVALLVLQAKSFAAHEPQMSPVLKA